MRWLGCITVFIAGVVCTSSAARAGKHDRAARLEKQFKRVEEAIRATKLAKARALLDAAARDAGRDWESLNQVMHYRTTIHAYRRNFAKAADVIIGRLPALAKRRDGPHEFWAHNRLMMLRAARGDVSGALLECAEMTAVGNAGVWKHPDRARSVQVQLKDLWHRALYLRLRAEQVKGAERKALLLYAKRAKVQYTRVAKTQKGFDDSIAVLDVVFAVHDKNKRAALKAARRVDISKNDDVEDLYLTFIGFKYAGDNSRANAVHQKMRTVPYVSHSNAVMLMWAERDNATAGERRWTPLHPTGRP